MEQFVAAHRTLPFQTWVEVTNLDNGKKVDVRIIDRGPFVDGCPRSPRADIRSLEPPQRVALGIEVKGTSAARRVARQIA